MVTAAATASKTRRPATGAAAPADAVLAWYDRHRRALPWRARPGERPDPYRVWLSEIMLQQTTVTAVRPYFERFLTRFATVEELAAAPAEAVMQAWAGLGYYSRARNLHACARAVAARPGGRFPEDEAELLALPGIGPYTAAAIAAIAFNRVAAPVDGNVERVITRFYAIEEALPAAKPAIRARTAALVPPPRPGDFAQAMMDLGATICTPKRPACALCPLTGPCAARRSGLQETFPRKAPKREGALRHGAAFVCVRADGAVLLRTRPPRGLLGGMAEVPGSDWTSSPNPAAWAAAPLAARWRRLPGIVRHVFTHFPLELAVARAEVAQGTPVPAGCRWAPAASLGGEALPNLMRKVLAHAGVEVRPVDG
ncbi:A/G-specific adenine glycosylase [Chelatococcus reniformis]|uniref:Adenine DNA glycosylase n=1 Tax=Chelatococcus reniformis TaxID=1494448 RepID=A0A916U6Z7_9HYPH|nr:A/G-specific adenine glycosylase [Chelatococcus reniformis]GGC62702.1 A/G-specific adenine glycosylase [Chelatococcus reniformis]